MGLWLSYIIVPKPASGCTAHLMGQSGPYSCSLFFQIHQLNALITMLLGELSPGDRQKIMTICTIDVHARDVVAKLVLHKVIW